MHIKALEVAWSLICNGPTLYSFPSFRIIITGLIATMNITIIEGSTQVSSPLGQVLPLSFSVFDSS